MLRMPHSVKAELKVLYPNKLLIAFSGFVLFFMLQIMPKLDDVILSCFASCHFKLLACPLVKHSILLQFSCDSDISLNLLLNSISQVLAFKST